MYYQGTIKRSDNAVVISFHFFPTVLLKMKSSKKEKYLDGDSKIRASRPLRKPLKEKDFRPIELKAKEIMGTTENILRAISKRKRYRKIPGSSLNIWVKM